ncbi:polyunsaturated fatty acid 5-lipoxygenase-like [Oscarella lobularis]|uniref:polyunsaturated fatty acid 5-lipoxygenase-like n=1 Tax=Oscarella lobularis TaxID=121494 RepID=UPI0033132C2C
MGADQSTVKYEIIVQTRKKSNRAKQSVNMTIIGSAGTTRGILLKPFKDDEQEKKFTIKEADVGTLHAVTLSLRSGDHWHAGAVIISTYEEKEVCFPCYHSVTSQSELYVARKNASLPFNDKEPLQKLRAADIQKWRDFLPWCEPDGIPNYSSCAQLPPDLQFAVFCKKIDMGIEAVEGLLNKFFEDAIDCVVPVLKSFPDYKSLYENKCFPSSDLHENKFVRVFEDLKEDESFGRQFLQGVHPTALFCVKESLPEKFPVTDEMVDTFLEGLGQNMAEMRQCSDSRTAFSSSAYSFGDGARGYSTPSQRGSLSSSFQVSHSPHALHYRNQQACPGDASKQDWLCCPRHVCWRTSHGVSSSGEGMQLFNGVNSIFHVIWQSVT